VRDVSKIKRPDFVIAGKENEGGQTVDLIASVIDSKELETANWSLARYLLPRTKRHGIRPKGAWHVGYLFDFTS